MKRQLQRAAILLTCLLTIASAAAATNDVRVLHAGSLTTLFQRDIRPAMTRLGFHLEAEGRGSVANANMIRDGLRRPDVFVSADDRVMSDLMRAAPENVAWYIPLAASRIVIA